MLKSDISENSALHKSCLIDDPLRLDTYLMPFRLEAGRGHGFSASPQNILCVKDRVENRRFNFHWNEKRGMDETSFSKHCCLLLTLHSSMSASSVRR